MKHPPYSFVEANELCEEFQFIKGYNYHESTSTKVSAVVVTPFDHVSKNRFVMLFLMLNDAKTVLSMDYAGAQYDVIVVTGSIAENNFQYTNLHSWIRENEHLLEEGLKLSEFNNKN
jgi:hypothetical protein